MTIDVRGMTPLLQVYDMATSLRFCCDILGFKIVQTDSNTTSPNHNWVWPRLNDIDLMLNTAYEYDKRPAAANPRAASLSTTTPPSTSELRTSMPSTPTCAPKDST
jgi:hypothetical protein